MRSECCLRNSSAVSQSVSARGRCLHSTHENSCSASFATAYLQTLPCRSPLSLANCKISSLAGFNVLSSLIFVCLITSCITYCMNNAILKSKISKLPKSPGVYEFLDKKGKILYIGKATNLRDRVGSYFASGAHADRPNISRMVADIAGIRVHETDSVLEALILESNLIKKHQPKYNVMSKDDKSFGYFVITHAPKQSLVRGKAPEEFPRVIIARKTNLGKISAKKIYGPYLSVRQMQTALKIIRRIFPFHSNKQPTEKGCLDYQIGRCPGPYAGAISKKDYFKNIHGIEMIFEGKKKYLLKELEKQMREYSREGEFEKAAEARNRIFALKHIRDVALLTGDADSLGPPRSKKMARIEAYDISNIGGDFAVGSMVVFSGNKLEKSQYRKFKIKTGMPTLEATAHCPAITFEPVNFPRYIIYSKAMMDILRTFTPDVEEYSIDEAFFDLTSVQQYHGCSYEQIARNIQKKN